MPPTHISRLAAVFVVLLFSAEAGAQGRELRPARVAVPPVIDGVLDEVWQNGAIGVEFRQLEPAFGTPASVRTELFVAYDTTHVYLAARLWQPRESIRAAAARRDSAEVTNADFVTFALDPQLNGNAAYFFTFNPAGAVADGLLDSSAVWSRDWDGVFSHAVSVGDDCWVVEMALPLSTLSFQRRRVQDWGFLVERRYATAQERDVSSLPDPHHPYRIDTFARLTGLADLAAATRYTLLPYAYTAYRNERAPDAGALTSKIGGDLRLTPTPAVTILATVRPDYAQLESDAEIINVSDVPTSYPEKRPFFTESSDLYPGLAVNTRNILDVDAGVKLRGVLPTLRYDATMLRDRDGATWSLGDVRWTDNRSYHVELIGGLKDRAGHRDYNVTTNLRTWWLEKRLTAYTWIGTINGPTGGGNEFETVNAVKWLSRTFDGGVWSHVKSRLYNPNIVGSNTLSNEVIVSAWAAPSVIRPDGWLRRVKPTVKLDHDRLYSRGEGYTVWTGEVEAEIHPHDRIGNWIATVTHQPGTYQLFRYRNTGSRIEALTDTDAFGPFVLREHRIGRDAIEIRSDTGKRISVVFRFDTPGVRGATSTSVTAGAAWRLSPASTASYEVDRMDIAESPWQRATTLAVQRLRVEYAIGNTLNVRAIAQTRGATTLDGVAGDAESRTPTFNVAVAWRRNPTTSLFVVYSDARASERSSTGIWSATDRSLAVKVARALIF